MKRARSIVLLAASTAAAVAVVDVHATVDVHTSPSPSAARCGGPLWRLKTFSDVQRGLVQLAPRSTTIAALNALRGPSVAPARRTTAFQRATWEVVAQIVSFRLDGNEVRLSLFDQRTYINAVIPATSCLSTTTRKRSAIAAIRSAFETRCGHPTSASQPLGAVAYVNGVGFWSGRTTRRGAAPNGAELHPVTGFRLVVGCGT